MDDTDMKAGAMDADNWPSGSFSFPMPYPEFCPSGFEEGYVFQDRGIKSSSNTHLVDGSFSANYIIMSYCTKTDPSSSSSSYSWPAGRYCIARYGNTCPAGFSSASISWRDSNNDNKHQSFGAIPDGKYNGRQITMNYCCRNDGHHINPIVLPTSHSFILYRKYCYCQRVQGMSYTTIKIYLEAGYGNNRCYGNYPSGWCGRTLYLCLYHRL